jgi:predicted metal-binding membrane protein
MATPDVSLGPRAAEPLGLLAVLTGAAWALTLYQTFSMSMPMGIVVRGGMTADGMGGMAIAGMSAGGWSLGGAVVFVAVWPVMMAAMMLPAAAPMILIFASAQARRERATAIPTWIFTAGYILVWLAAGLPRPTGRVGRRLPSGPHCSRQGSISSRRSNASA